MRGGKLVDVDDENVDRRRCQCSLTVMCGIIAVLSLTFALTCFNRELKMAIQLNEFNNNLTQLKNELYELRSLINDNSFYNYIVNDTDIDDEEDDIENHENEINENNVTSAVNVVSESFQHTRYRRQAGNKRRTQDNNNNNNNNNNARKPKQRKVVADKPSLSLESVIHVGLQPGTQLSKEPDRVLKGWSLASWSKHSNKHPLHHHKSLTIDQSGHYLIYAQIGYYTNAHENGFSVVVKATQNDDRVLTRCMLGVDYVQAGQSASETMRYKTCHTSTVAHLSANEKLELFDDSIADNVQFHSDEYTHYWGVIKLA